MPLNDKDLQALDERIAEQIKIALESNNQDLIERFKEYFASKHEVKEITREVIQEEIRLLPTKKEFFNRIDKMLKKYETFEVEKAGLENKQSELSDRVESLEDRLSLSS